MIKLLAILCDIIMTIDILLDNVVGISIENIINTIVAPKFLSIILSFRFILDFSHSINYKLNIYVNLI
jgi:hypothetical protein